MLPQGSVDQQLFAEGPYCYLLRNPVRYEQPTIAKGKVSISWKLDDKLIMKVTKSEKKIIADPLINSRVPK